MLDGGFDTSSARSTAENNAGSLGVPRPACGRDKLFVPVKVGFRLTSKEISGSR